jgi:thioesterase domain-containing protein
VPDPLELTATEDYGGAIVYSRARERDAHNPVHPEAAWSGRAAGGMEIVEVPGNHITMSSPPHAATLGHELRVRIRRLEGA